MEEIKKKIQELLKVSAENFDNLLGVKGGNWSEKFDEKMATQERLMDELAVLAKANKTILGRILKFQRGDGYAIYLITNISATKATVKWLDYCDGWVDDMCGYGCTMSLSKAADFVRRRDALDELFSAHKAAMK